MVTVAKTFLGQRLMNLRSTKWPQHRSFYIQQPHYLLQVLSFKLFGSPADECDKGLISLQKYQGCEPT